MSKKIVAMLMAVAMAFSLLPVTAFAGNTSLLPIKPDEGSFATYEFYKIKDDTSSLWYTQIVKTGDTLNRPADPTRTGFYFTGWKTADGGEVPFGPVTAVTGTSPIKCYAQWEKNANPIHVYFMAAEMAAEGSQEVVYTGVAQNGAVAIPEDYKDIIWKTKDNETFDGKNVTGDMNVYPASASCWLTFDSQGGSAVASHYVQQDQDFDLSKVSDPEKAGYTFAGWSLTTDGASVTQVTPTQDTKLYALWTPATADYTVIHWQENANDNEYSYIASEKKSGTTGTQTNATSKQYDGFEAKTITQKTINGDGSTIVNVYYQRNSYTIHFYYREPGRWEEYTDIQITAKYGADIRDKWPEKKGSKTWSTNENYNLFNGGLQSPYQVNIETMPLGGAKYYGPKTDKGSQSAHYYVEVLPGETGTVTQGGVTYKLHHTDTTPGTGYEVSKEDQYPLTGFAYNGGTQIGQPYENAKFYYTRNSYDVVYISNGAEKKESYRYEENISGAGSYTPTNAPDGYKFGGWCSDPSGTTPYKFSGKKMPAQHITVYAKWVPTTLKLTIRDVDGVGSGDVSYKQTINKAGVYQQATDKLTAANKTVLYWVNCETNQKEDVNRQMTTNLTIRPVLKGDTYTVTYTSGANDSQKYWYNTIAKVKNYTGDNAGKFLYWTDTANNNKKYHPGDEIQMTANVTLKPKFSGENPGQTKYSVIYHSNFEPDQTCTADSVENYTTFFTKTYEETRLPSQNGYEFTGWNTQSDGGGTSFAAGGPALMNGANDNDLYAQWQPCTYTLTYDANGGQFGSGDSAPATKQESDIRAGDHPLKYTGDYTPTHAKSEGKNVVFLGWSEKDDSEKIYDKGDTIPNLIQSVTINGNKTVYAVWGYDAIGKDNKPDGVPDVFNAVVTYNIVGGTWDGTNDSATEVIKVKTFDETTKVWTNTNAELSSIPNINEVKPDKNHTSSGSWGNSDSTPTEDTVVTADKMYTYTLSEVTTGTLTITKTVVGDGLTVDSLPENFQITVKDAQDNIKGTLTKTEEAKKADGTLTWTIFDLPAGEYTVSEENAGVDGYTYKDTYTSSKDADTGKSVTVAVNETSTMTVTNIYTKNAKVNLSQLIQKQLTLKDGNTLPDNTTFTVTVKPEKVNDQTVEKPKSISGSVTVSALKSGTQNGDTYTAPFIFDNDGTLSLSAGTHTYTVQENATSPISGMKYDSEEYTLTITVNNDSSYTATYATEATTEAKATPLTIKNTYQTPDLSVTKQTVSVGGKAFDSNTVAHVNDQIIWSVTVTNKNSTPARVTLTDAMAEGVYTDNECKTQATNVNWDATAHSWTATVSGEVTYYVNYTVKEADIPKGKIVNTIVMKNGDEEKTDNSEPVSTWDTKQLKSATGRLETSDWTTTVTLTLPTVNSKPGTQSDSTTAISKGSYVIDQIGNKFTFKNGLSLEVNGKEISVTQDETNKNLYHFRTETGGTDLYTVTYTDKNDETKTPAQFKWEINQDIPAGTKVTLSYKLELTTREKNPGTYGVEDLNGDNKTEPGKTPIYTNEKAALYIKEKENNQEKEIAVFPKPSVSYTIKSSSGSHSGGSRPSLNTKDHYGYIIGYPVDYYTGQPTTDQTKKPVRPEGKITRAEVATIYFRMLTDESRTKFWSQSNAYSDVKAGDWFNNAVSTLSNAGIIAGYEDGSFRPNGYITRAEFATIAARFFDVTYNGKDLFPDISGHWAKDYINQAANKGFVNGYEDGTFKPDRNITRAEAVTLVNRTLDRHPDKSHFTKDMLVWPDNMDQTKWYYADMQEATNSHTYQMKENSDKTKYENWTKTLPIRNWEALEKAWSNANSSQGNGNVV